MTSTTSTRTFQTDSGGKKSRGSKIVLLPSRDFHRSSPGFFSSFAYVFFLCRHSHRRQRHRRLGRPEGIVIYIFLSFLKSNILLSSSFSFLKENYETNDNDNITPINNSRLQKYQRQGIPTQEEKGVLNKEGIVFFSSYIIQKHIWSGLWLSTAW